MSNLKIETRRKHVLTFIVSKRFITINCLLNRSFRIVYDQDEKKFINSCKYCGKQCKIRKLVDKYIKRGEPFNFKDLTEVTPKKRKRQKIKNKKIL